MCSRFGYEERNRVGSHIVLQRMGIGLPHITIPAHKTIATGTLSKILPRSKCRLVLRERICYACSN